MHWLPLRMMCVGLAAMASVASAAPAEPADESARLARERSAIIQRFADEERACRERFASTGCVEDVRLRRRETLAPVREAEFRLMEAERQQRAAERRRNVAEKQQAAASRPAAAPLPELRVRPSPPVPAATAASGRAVARQDDEAQRQAQAAQRSLAAQRRQAEAEAAQKRVADRLAQREAQGKKAQPLPASLPPSSPARQASAP